MSEERAPARRLARGGSRTFGEMEEEAMQAAGELPAPALPPAPGRPVWPEIDEIDDNEAAAALTAEWPTEEEDSADGR